jgi:prepilin-type N-terminal cleavage/methylation domain-containing protein
MARAFTLLELLIAVALVVLVAGLALPAVWGRTEGARLDTALRQLGAAVIAARAEAQRGGAVSELRVVATAEGEALVIRRLGDVEIRGTDDDLGGEAAAVVRPWTVLPSGVRVLGEPPSEGGTSPAHRRENSGAAGEHERRAVRVAVMLPDGTAVASGPVYVSVGERVVEVSLNRWSGGASERELPRRGEGIAAPGSGLGGGAR